MARRDKAWLEQLRERAEQSLSDVEHLLGYDPMLGEDGQPRVGADGKPILVSRCSEASRVKLNLALIGLHPENVKNDAGTSIRFEISGDVVKLAFGAAGEVERASFLDIKPDRVMLPVPDAK